MMAEEEEEDIEVIPDEFLHSEYDMVAEPGEATGLCVIFNSTTFAARCLPTREGSKKDVASIQKVFGDIFGFEVIEMKDKTKAEMEAVLKAIADNFRHPWRCFVCFFLSHGLGEEYLADFDGKRVNVRLLVKLFDGDNCPRMVGKPKLFFAQMCRGFDAKEYKRSQKKYDAAEDVLFEDALPANVSPDRDRLVCYATTEGRMAPLDPENGSLFIQTLTKVLRAVGGERKIEEVLSIVTNMVDKKAEEKYKVCPVFDSTLIGKLTFPVRSKNAKADILVVKHVVEQKPLKVLEPRSNRKSDFMETLQQSLKRLVV